MDDIQIIEVIEAVRERLIADMPDLDALLARLIVTDYRSATAGDLQECLAQVTYGLDSRNPNDARTILLKIANAEHQATVAVPRGVGRAPSWVMQEPAAIEVENPEQEEDFAKGIRYLSIAGSGTNGNGNAKIPTQFGEELHQCKGARQALSLVRKRLPGLKGIAAYEFLVSINYPVAVPTADAQRFCKFVGLISTDEKSAAERYMIIIERASRITGVPMSHIGHMLALYSGGKPVGHIKPVCGKQPRCGDCKLSARCSYYEENANSPSELKASPAESERRTIKDWHIDDRPRERLLAGERLSNSELLAIILRTGTGRLSAVELARELLHEFETLHDLEKASPQEIVERMRGKGIGPAKAAEICAAIELGRRVTQPAADTRLGQRLVTSSRDIFELCRPRYKAATQEEFLLLVLNTKNRLQKEVPVSLGTLNSSIVHPRDVFRHALREAAAAVIFVHNHPSGDPSPSDEDILLTARLVDGGKLLGIQVLDHVIVGSHEWYSFADHGRLK